MSGHRCSLGDTAVVLRATRDHWIALRLFWSTWHPRGKRHVGIDLGHWPAAETTIGQHTGSSRRSLPAGA